MYDGIGVNHIWMIGSGARGNFEQESDLDILMISEEDKTLDLMQRLQKDYPSIKKFDICFYTPYGIENIIRTGSLFGWHIKKEGVSLYDKDQWFEFCLRQIVPYHRHLEDLQLLLRVSTETLQSIIRSELTLEYDGGVISTCIRNSSIIMVDYFGLSDFTPMAHLSLEKVAPESLHAPITDVEYNILLSCRRQSERGASVNVQLNKSLLIDISKKIISWQKRCIKIVSTREDIFCD